MSRSGYVDASDCDNLELYRQAVERAIKGKRGQAFLREMAKAMDEMPKKELIRNELISANGEVCAIGSVCKAKSIDVSKVDERDPVSVGRLMGISRSMAAEIAYENDESDYGYGETDEQRWRRMRRWINENLVSE